MKIKLSRRSFLRGAAATSAALGVGTKALASSPMDNQFIIQDSLGVPGGDELAERMRRILRAQGVIL